MGIAVRNTKDKVVGVKQEIIPAKGTLGPGGIGDGGLGWFQGFDD